MANRFKFVNGDGGTSHENALEEASKEGYAVKFVSSDLSNLASMNNKPIVVLMERLEQERNLSMK